MPSWSMGYQSDHLYTYGYYQEMNPLRAKFLFNCSGLAFPDVSSGYACELGFGQGISVNMHAVASTTNWWGTDFNPAQVNFARRIAEVGGAQVHLEEEAFGDFAAREDLPMFDYIALHGIWSWISPENQNFIVDFIKKKLKVGGILYISYNVSPGFMSFEPVRHLMKLYNDKVLPPSMDIDEKIKKLQDFFDELIETSPAVFSQYPLLPIRIKKSLSHGSHYIFAEYMNTFWDISHFSKIEEVMDRAKLSYACSAWAPDHFERGNLTQEQVTFLQNHVAGTPLYQDTYDFLTSQQFRRDYFVRGARQLTPTQQAEELQNTYLILQMPLKDFTYTYTTRLGKFEVNKDLYEAVLSVFADYTPHSIGEVLSKVKNFTDKEVYDALRTLALFNTLTPAMPLKAIKDNVKKRCRKLNADILDNKEIGNISFLASPVTQGAIFVSDVNRRLLSAHLHRIPNKDLLEFILKELQSHNATINHDGKEITDPKEQRVTLEKMVNNFEKDVLPVYRGLMLI